MAWIMGRLTKSGHNVKSAVTLVNESFFAPSLHCSYYSCVQLMLHVFHEKMGLDEDALKNTFNAWRKAEQKKLIDQAKAEGKEIEQKNFSQHIFYITFMLEKLKSLNVMDSVRFYESVNRLRGLRLKADYSAETISEDEAEDGINTAQETMVVLQKHYLQ